MLDRFATVASATVFAHNGFVDKFVGDEVVAFFAPVLGPDHAARAIDAGTDLLRATGHGDEGGPWVPIGAGVHTGQVWFGAVGDGGHVELTALGDPVNVTARLAAEAGAGDLLVSVDAAEAAGLSADLSRRALALKGRQDQVEVVTFVSTSCTTPASAPDRAATLLRDQPGSAGNRRCRLRVGARAQARWRCPGPPPAPALSEAGQR